MNIDSIEQDVADAALQRPRRLISTGVPWSVDLRAGTVLHESGIVISFTRSQAPGAPAAVDQQATSLDMCWAPGGGPVWTLSADTAALRDTVLAFGATEQRAANRLLATLARHAGQAWLSAWTQTRSESPAVSGIAQRRADIGPRAAAVGP
jgi:hypothetical protein